VRRDPPPAAAGRRGIRIPPDWQPRPQTVEALVSPISGNVPAQFVQEQIPQFVAYWLDRGEPAESWDALFRKQTLTHWKKTGHEWVAQPAPAVQRQGAFDALTDRSWAAGLVADDPDPYEPDAPLLGVGAH
jgi:hypothetical protein